MNLWMIKLFGWTVETSRRYLLTGLAGCFHGPAVWPWWKLVAFSVVKLDDGWRLWIYVNRRGLNVGRFVDLYRKERL